jgi:subtilisin family serine protease
MKIVPSQTIDDSIRISYFGDTVIVPKFYNCFELIIPRSYKRILGENYFADTLNSIDLDCYFAESLPNYLLLGDDCEPNDTYYYLQYGLHPSTGIPSGNINVEEAWCIAGAGDVGTTVAIADGGIRWSHEDFGDGSFSGSVISGGYDYNSNSDDPQDFWGSPHGTSCASIVGAVRNNSIGVAGIVGGSGSADGARLVALDVGADNWGFTLTKVFNSIIDAVDIYSADVYSISAGSPNNGNFLHKALYYANRMGMVVCASRGNSGNTDSHFPATCQEKWVLSVGGSNTVGQPEPQSSSGQGVDLIAPFSPQLNYTCSGSNSSGYVSFQGTSASTPYVAGLAALIQSYYGGTLSPDAIAHIIKSSAVPLSTTIPNDQSGYGLCDAGSAIKLIEKPKCNILSFGVPKTPHHDATSVSVTPPGPVEIYLRHDGFVANSGTTLPQGSYEFQLALQFDVFVDHSIPTGYEIVDYWPENSSSNTMPLYATTPIGSYTLVPAQSVEIVSISESEAHLRGYGYDLKKIDDCTIDGLSYSGPVVMNYSVLVCQIPTEVTNTFKENLLVTPNPFSENIVVSIPPQFGRISKFEIYDNLGRLVKKLNASVVLDQTITVDLSQVPTGVYFILVQGDNGQGIKKIIKH